MKGLDYSLIDQIDQHQKERKAAEWQEKVEQAKRIGSMQAKIQAIVIVIAILTALVLIPAPFPR